MIETAAAPAARSWSAIYCPAAALTGSSTLNRSRSACHAAAAESSDGTVSGLRIGGEVVWLAKTGAGLSRSPVIMDNSVFVGAEDHGLYCLTPFGEPVV